MRSVDKGRDWYSPKQFRRRASAPRSFWWLAGVTLVLCLAVLGALALVVLLTS